VTDVDGMPVLWFYGPPGVGKTTVGWELYTQLAKDGTTVGYVDIDQLGMCYAAPTSQNWAPEPADDPGRHRLKAASLNAVLPNFRAAGARCVIVSGVVDADRGVEADLMTNAELTRCRLRVDAAALRSRIAVRGRPADEVEECVREADALDLNHSGDATVDTTGLSMADVVTRVRTLLGAWPPGITSACRGGALACEPTGPILWIHGPTAVGKSSVGWQVYQQVRSAGVRAAYVDLAQLGFHRPAGDVHCLRAANLASVWHNYHAAGARCLVVVGPLDGARSADLYREALPGTAMTLCRLHASRETLTERIQLRGLGQSPAWGLAGDELIGQSADTLRRVAARAATQAEELERADLVGLRVDTDGRAPTDLAEEILRRAEWPI
jgi:molybdopterin-guanine dinucleotide biosynthesis protein